MKSQDIVIWLKIFLHRDWPIPKIAHFAKISVTEVYVGIKRLEQVGLLLPPTSDTPERNPNCSAMLEFLFYGMKYVFPVEMGTETRGIPTAHSAPPLSKVIVADKHDVYVWPFEFGEVRGLAVEPLYRTVPEAVAGDNELYELLALIDAIRVGRAREIKIAQDELSRRLKK
jgi:hypothetical protein